MRGGLEDGVGWRCLSVVDGGEGVQRLCRKGPPEKVLEHRSTLTQLNLVILVLITMNLPRGLLISKSGLDNVKVNELARLPSCLDSACIVLAHRQARGRTNPVARARPSTCPAREGNVGVATSYGASPARGLGCGELTPPAVQYPSGLRSIMRNTHSPIPNHVKILKISVSRVFALPSSRLSFPGQVALIDMRRRTPARIPAPIRPDGTPTARVGGWMARPESGSSPRGSTSVGEYDLTPRTRYYRLVSGSHPSIMTSQRV